MKSHFLDTVEIEIPIKSNFVKFGQRIDFKVKELNQHFTGIVPKSEGSFMSLNSPSETYGGVTIKVNTGKDFVIKWALDLNFSRNIYNKPQKITYDINGQQFGQEWHIEKNEIKLEQVDKEGKIYQLPEGQKIVGSPAIIRGENRTYAAAKNYTGRKSFFTVDSGAGDYLARINTLKGSYFAHISILSEENQKYDLTPELMLKSGKTYENDIIGTLIAGNDYQIRFKEDGIKVFRVDAPVDDVKKLSRTKAIKNNGEFFVISRLNKGLNFFVATKSDGVKTYINNFRILAK